MVLGSPELKWALALTELASGETVVCSLRVLVVRMPVCVARMLPLNVLHNSMPLQLCLEKRFCSCVGTSVQSSDGRVPCQVSALLGQKRAATVHWRVSAIVGPVWREWLTKPLNKTTARLQQALVRPLIMDKIPGGMCTPVRGREKEHFETMLRHADYRVRPLGNGRLASGAVTEGSRQDAPCMLLGMVQTSKLCLAAFAAH